jgi:hypothetical protein
VRQPENHHYERWLGITADEVVRHDDKADPGGVKVICSRGKADDRGDKIVRSGVKAGYDEVGIIRGGGKASDAERIVETRRSRNSLTPVLELILLLVIGLDGSVMFNLHAKSGCMRALLGLGRVAVWSS